jgi:hypothetical protein
MNNSLSLKKTINDYLHYGYLPPEEIPRFFLKLKKESTPEYSVKTVSDLLDNIFKDLFSEYSNIESCIVPISGGWDSRVLLGMALKHFSPERIKTYTFGVPGQLDFEIGKKVAKKAGVKHQAINLYDIQITWEGLLGSVEESPWTYVPDSFFNKYCYRLISQGNDIVLSGFMGDPLTGGHKYLQNDKDVVEYFAKQQSVIRSQKITSKDYHPSFSLPKLPESNIFSRHQLLDLGVRQACCITPIISSKRVWEAFGDSLGQIRNTNAQLLTPFARKDWIQYWVDAPEEVIEKQKLYLQVLEDKFPILSRVPSKNYYGAKKANGLNYYLKRKAYHGQILLNQNFPAIFSEPVHMLNYLNFSFAFRERDDYKTVLNTAIQFLRKNSIVPWLDLHRYLHEHRTRENDHSKLFLLLIGLALNLSVNPE